MDMELSRLAVLPARPPTPPKEASGFPSSQDSDPVQAPKASHPGLHTPKDSPSSAHPSSKSSEGRSKRVGFRLGSSKLNNASSSSPDQRSSPRSNPSSKDRKPAKSILKPARKIDVPAIEAGQARDFPRMLEDFCQQLAGSEMSVRLDAYVTLNSNLKTYKNGPEQRALVEKMPLLTSFVERDLQDADTTSTARSTQLATEVVKLVSTLLWSPIMADELPESFQLFVLNKAINVAGSETAPKSLVSQFLHLLAIQKFRSKIFTNEKISRLISSLKHIEDRVKGKQIIAHRLDIYKRLIAQAPSLMSSRFRDWYEHIFIALMSTTKEIRSRALSLGFEAGHAFGASEQVTKTVSSLFSHVREVDGTEQRYGDLFAARLGEWLASKEDARHVPQVWSCVLMFLRHQPRPLERWNLILTWLQLMKKCFNSTDNETRLQANRAWTRLIFAIDPCLTTGDSMVALLREPIRSQLDRARGGDKDTARMRGSVIAVYSTLLYYALRPGATFDTLDRYWKACVSPFFSTPQERVATLEVHTATEVLCSLLGDRPGKSWSPKRAAEAVPIKVEEIPRLDSKWVRHRASWLTPVIEAILLDESWWKSSTEHPPSLRVWKCFVGSLADAGRKEIKVSTEAKAAVSELVGALDSFLTNCKSPATYERFARLIEAASLALGPLPFTEPKFTGVSNGRYQIAENASTHSKKLGISGASAATILLRQLVCADVSRDLAGLEESQSKLLEISLRSASSPRTRLVALREAYSRSLPKESNPQIDASKFALWQIAIRLVSSSCVSKQVDATNESAQVLTYDFHDATKLFGYAFELQVDHTKIWSSVEEVIDAQLSGTKDQATSCTQVVEPLAKFFHDRIRCSMDYEATRAIIQLLDNVHWPNRQAVADATQRRVPGFSSPSPKNISLDPYKNLYGLLQEVLTLLYAREQAITHETFVNLLSALSTLINKSPNHAAALVLPKLQPALSPWIVDSEGKLNTDSADAIDCFKHVVELWETVLEKIHCVDSFDASTFTSLRELILLGLSSRHRAITNTTIKTWNTTFGFQTQLPYKNDFKQVLIFLSQSADIALPDTADSADPSASQFSIEYLNTPSTIEELSQNGADDDIVWEPKDWSLHGSREPLAPLSQNEQTVSTPPRQKASQRTQTTPKLRHDDSQIEFAEITSSPPNLETIESQLLTERQREVRDRQQAVAAAMFPDLRSSPRAKVLDRTHELPRLQLHGQQDLEQSDIDETQSPTLPSPSGTPYLGSSPTPSQRRQSSRDRQSVAPEAPEDDPLQNRKAMLERTNEKLLQSPTVPIEFGQTYGEELLALYEQPADDDNSESVDIVVPSDYSSLSSLMPSDAGVATEYDIEQDGSVDALPKTAQNVRADLATSTFDILSSPRQSESTRQESLHETRIDMLEYESSQVEAQILSDMVEASSKKRDLRSAPITQSFESSEAPTSQELPAKRKRGKGHGDGRSNKRSRGRPRKQQQQSSEPNQLDEEMEDCIIVAVHPASSLGSIPSEDAAPSQQDETALSPASYQEKPSKSRKRKHAQYETSEIASDVSETSSPKKSKRSLDSDTREEPLESNPRSSDQPAIQAAGVEAKEDSTAARESVGTQTSPSRHRIPAITGDAFLAKVRELLSDAKQVVLGGTGDDVMSSLMEIGREIMTAKRRE